MCSHEVTKRDAGASRLVSFLALARCALCNLAELEEFFVGLLALEGLETLVLLNVLRLDTAVVTVAANLWNDAGTLYALGEAADKVCGAFAAGLFYLDVG